MNESPDNLASRWKRLGGSLIDFLIMSVIIIPVIMSNLLGDSLAQHEMVFGRQVAYSVLGLSVFFILNGYLLLYRGQTIGKVVVKTRIVNLNGGIPNFGRLLILRYFIPTLAYQTPIAGPIASLANALAIFGQERRCLHDYLAGTRVVDARSLVKE